MTHGGGRERENNYALEQSYNLERSLTPSPETFFEIQFTEDVIFENNLEEKERKEAIVGMSQHFSPGFLLCDDAPWQPLCLGRTLGLVRMKHLLELKRAMCV